MDVVDVTERMMAEFEGRLPLNVISKVVNGCRRDLRGTAATALPELLERLARQRLLDLLDRPGVPTPRNPRATQAPVELSARPAAAT